MSDEAKDLICRLLVKSPAQRLSAQEVRQHVWITNYFADGPASSSLAVASVAGTSAAAVLEAQVLVGRREEEEERRRSLEQQKTGTGVSVGGAGGAAAAAAATGRLNKVLSDPSGFLGFGSRRGSTSTIPSPIITSSPSTSPIADNTVISGVHGGGGGGGRAWASSSLKDRRSSTGSAVSSSSSSSSSTPSSVPSFSLPFSPHSPFTPYASPSSSPLASQSLGSSFTFRHRSPSSLLFPIDELTRLGGTSSSGGGGADRDKESSGSSDKDRDRERSNCEAKDDSEASIDVSDVTAAVASVGICVVGGVVSRVYGGVSSTRSSDKIKSNDCGGDAKDTDAKESKSWNEREASVSMPVSVSVPALELTTKHTAAKPQLQPRDGDAKCVESAGVALQLEEQASSSSLSYSKLSPRPG